MTSETIRSAYMDILKFKLKILNFKFACPHLFSKYKNVIKVFGGVLVSYDYMLTCPF